MHVIMHIVFLFVATPLLEALQVTSVNYRLSSEPMIIHRSMRIDNGNYNKGYGLLGKYLFKTEQPLFF